jgi:hypothetical protein
VVPSLRLLYIYAESVSSNNPLYVHVYAESVSSNNPLDVQNDFQNPALGKVRFEIVKFSD